MDTKLYKEFFDKNPEIKEKFWEFVNTEEENTYNKVLDILNYVRKELPKKIKKYSDTFELRDENYFYGVRVKNDHITYKYMGAAVVICGFDYDCGIENLNFTYENELTMEINSKFYIHGKYEHQSRGFTTWNEIDCDALKHLDKKKVLKIVVDRIKYYYEFLNHEFVSKTIKLYEE